MKNSFNYKLCALFLIIGLTLSISGCTISKTPESQKDLHQDIDKLIEIIKNHSFYYENDAALYDGALRGIVEALNDPYSVYFDETEYKNFINQLKASFAGLGVTIGTKGNYPIITSVIKSSPAEKAGFKVGDTIKSVDGTDLSGKAPSEVPPLIKGEKGTVRTIEIIREDHTKPQTITVTLDIISSNTVNSKIINEGNQKIGYLQITTFGEPTVKEFEAAMNHFKDQKINGLIIDVRNNPGGYLGTVTSMLDYFIESEKPFMYQQSKNEEKKPYYLKDGKSYDLEKLVVLINEASASASEIFAATLNELKGYQLIGKTTFGKGTVQVTDPINSNETKWTKYTTSIWLTSTGSWIHGNGVKPTIEIEQHNFKDLGFIEYSENLFFDSVDQEIKELQLLLKRLGYETRTDGYFNTQTTNALFNFQKDYMGLDKATGFVTEETVYKLNLELIKYVNNLNYDEQYLKAIEFITQN